MEKLSSLPNIGKTLEEKLMQAGIQTPEDLLKAGSENALLRIRAFDDSACFNMLCALEGAIQGIRWHGLPGERKEELKQFLKMNQIHLTPINK
ncbi:MAG: TfoX/Sxy family protein [Bacteroidetes bacterium]|nr:TfoX/Sxy family protein [Bacteroidota bacterium]